MKFSIGLIRKPNRSHIQNINTSRTKNVYNVLDIARYIAWRSNEIDSPVTNSKLQRLLYFVQAAFLVFREKPCYLNEIEAWEDGPVVSRVYYQYQAFEYRAIPSPYKEEDFLFIDKADRELIDAVIKKFAEYCESQMSSIIFRQTPWITACRSDPAVIPCDFMKAFFEEK